MRIRGIHYDIGTTTIQGSSTRPVFSAEQAERELRDIRDGLGANAVRITGGDIGHMTIAADCAANLGLGVWLSPMLPNAGQADTMTGIVEAAAVAERLRSRGASVVLVVGCELSVFMAGIMPGDTHADRLSLLMDPARLMGEVAAKGIDPQAEMAAFLHTAADRARAVFGGPLTYASGMWEDVDWSGFDFVGVDAYRDAFSREGYAETLRALTAHGLPVVVTEAGCATYAGAADAGGMAWTAVERSRDGARLREGIERDEAEQARELSAVLEIVEKSALVGAFVFTYIAPSYPSSPDPHRDLDAASYALVRSWPDGRVERKAAYAAVAEAFSAGSLVR
jgi:hypothetical protein